MLPVSAGAKLDDPRRRLVTLEIAGVSRSEAMAEPKWMRLPRQKHQRHGTKTYGGEYRESNCIATSQVVEDASGNRARESASGGDRANRPSMPRHTGAPISAEMPSRLLAPAVLQPLSTRRITKYTETPSLTKWRSAIAVDKNPNARRRRASSKVNCGLLDVSCSLSPAPDAAASSRK